MTAVYPEIIDLLDSSDDDGMIAKFKKKQR